MKRDWEESMATTPLSQPEFQLLVNPKTGQKRGRIYFPKSYISQNLTELTAWLKQNKIYFTQKSVKRYQDGSFRLIFESNQNEYEALNKWNTTTTDWAEPLLLSRLSTLI